MRTLNVRLAAICIAVTVLLGGGIHLLHGFQVSRQADALRVASKQAEEKKDLGEAIRHLQSYVVLVPTDQKEKLRLGLLYAESRSAASASNMLENVLRATDGSLSPEEVREAHRKLVDVALMWRPKRWLDAATHLTQLLKETPDDPELLDLLGQVLVGCGRDKEACEQFTKAIKIAPSQIDTYLRLVFVLSARSDRKDDADNIMKLMIKKNPKSASAFKHYGHYFLEQAMYDEALAQAMHVLALVPEDPKGLWLAGRCWLAKGKYDLAEDYLIRGIKADKTDHAMYKVLADIKFHLNRPDEAMAVLKTGLENTKGTSGYADVLWDVINTEIDSGKFDKAQQDIQELRDCRVGQGAPFPAEKAEFVEARLSVMKGDWKAAKAVLDDVVPKLQDNPGLLKLAYLYLGQCYHQDGRIEQQIIVYREAARIDPVFFPARAGLAEIFVSRGNYAEAADQYRILVQATHPQVEAAPALARILIMQQVRMEKDKRDWEPAERLLNAIERQRSMSPGLAVLKAEVLLAKEQYSEAQTFLEKCAKQFPKSTQIWLALTNLAMYQAGQEADVGQKEARWKQASGYIDQAGQNLGDHLVVRLSRASCAVRRKDPRQIAILKECGENLDKMTDAEKTNLWSNLGALSVQAGDFELGRSYFRLMAEKEPKNVIIRYLLCDLNLKVYENGRTPDLQEIDQRLKEIEQLGGRGPFWLYCNAIRTFVTAKKTDPQYAPLLLEARRDLQKAMEVRRDWAALAVLSGKICELQDEPDDALEFYIRAVKTMGERDNDVLRRAVTLLVPRGRIEEARQLFDYLEKQKSPMLSQMKDPYVEVKVITGDIAEAAKDLKESVAPDSTNAKDFLRQGQMYGLLARRLRIKAQSATTDPKLAAKEVIDMAQLSVNALLRAKFLNPQADEVWIALVQLLVDVGQPDKARPLIAEAEQKLKSEQATITLARCCELLNETEKAQVKYEAAAKAAPQDSHILRQVAAFYLKNNKFELADPLLRQIVSMQTPATLTDTCWARRAQAVVLRTRGDFNHLCQAVALLDENLRSMAPTVDDKRIKVMLLNADPRKEKIGEAIAAMEDLVKSTDATPADYFSLAQLYLKKGDWNSYSDQMHSVLGTQKGAVQTKYLVFYINSLLEKKQLDDADKWLQSMEKVDREAEKKLSKQERMNLAHNLFDTMLLRAEYHFLREEYRAASDSAMAFLDNPDAQPSDRGQQLLLVGKLMEKFGDRARADGKRIVADGFAEKADTLFASQRSKRISESGDIVFASYLARQKRIRECLNVLEQCGDKVPPESLLLPAEAMFESKAADPAQFQQLEKILLSALNKSNRPIALLTALARLHAEQRQYDKSIAYYREIIAKVPRHYQAMNNLALCLARSGQNLEEALKLVNDTLAFTGPMPNVLDSRAIVYIARQEPEKALQDLAEAIKDEGTAKRYFHQAWTYSLAGMKTEAAAAFTEATKKHLDLKDLDPSEISVYDRLKNELYLNLTPESLPAAGPYLRRQ